MSIKSRLVTGFAVAALALTSLTASAQKKDPDVGGAAMYPTKNIVENAVNSPIHTTPRRRRQSRRSRRNALPAPAPSPSSRRPMTPSPNSPRARLTRSSSRRTKATLVKILTYHVVSGKYDAKMIEKMIKKGGGKATPETPLKASPSPLPTRAAPSPSPTPRAAPPPSPLRMCTSRTASSTSSTPCLCPNCRTVTHSSPEQKGCPTGHPFALPHAPHHRTTMRHHFNAEQWLPYPVELVFAFFSNPENLPRQMPTWQKARIEEATFAPPPPHPPGPTRHRRRRHRRRWHAPHSELPPRPVLAHPHPVGRRNLRVRLERSLLRYAAPRPFRLLASLPPRPRRKPHRQRRRHHSRDPRHRPGRV